MASIQAKKGKNGKKTYYVVVSLQGRHKWIRAGTQQQAKILKREIDSLENSKKIEKLGLTTRDRRIDLFFSEYLDHIRVRTSPNTVKRYGYAALEKGRAAGNPPKHIDDLYELIYELSREPEYKDASELVATLHSLSRYKLLAPGPEHREWTHPHAGGSGKASDSLFLASSRN